MPYSGQLHGLYDDKDFLEQFFDKHVDWSRSNFGDGDRTEGILSHLVLEVEEVRQAPFGSLERLEEVADLIILASDIVWRNGFDVVDLKNMLIHKQSKNSLRKWAPPDENGIIFHVKDEVDA